MSANNNINPSNGAAAATEQNTTISSSISHQEPSQRARAKDPFLFYSRRENLERARFFEEVDYSTEDSLHGTTLRKTRISFEKDAVSLMMDMLRQVQDENWKIFTARI